MDSLLSVHWELFNGDYNSNPDNLLLNLDTGEITHDELTNGAFISIYGMDEFMRGYISDVGKEDVIDELALPMIVDHIKSLLNPKLPISLMIGPPTFGDFILVYNVISSQTNHPEDPVEYDLNVDCVGILGKQVKFVYVGKS